jgi:hypothetical protein
MLIKHNHLRTHSTSSSVSSLSTIPSTQDSCRVFQPQQKPTASSSTQRFTGQLQSVSATTEAHRQQQQEQQRQWLRLLQYQQQHGQEKQLPHHQQQQQNV